MLHLRVSLWLAVLCALVATSLERVAAGCCADCLSQTDPKARVITYDPLVHLQCSAAVGICCYGCTFSHGTPAYQTGVTFNANGTVQTTAGTSVTLTFNGVSRITYDFLAKNQAKTTFVGNESTTASTNSDGAFVLCARTAGTIAFRGWGTDSCTQVTEEYTITVTGDGSTATCDVGTVKPAGGGGSTTKPNQTVKPQSDSSKKGEDDVENCSVTRGTVREHENGKQYCACVGDWRNPPMCDQYSWTKTILTILGAVATVFSIAFSVRAYLKSKKAEKEATENKDLEVLSDHEIETLRISPAKNQRDSSSSTGTMAASPATTVSMSSTKRSPVRTPLTTTSRHETTL